MHDYLLSTEWVRFAFVCGIAVSMLLYERRHLTTGSIVVPGYIAVFLLHPLVLVATFLNAFTTYALVNKVLRRYVLLYGRTKFTVLAVASTIIQTIMLNLTPSGPWLWESDIPIFVGVGYIVPALIAHDMARQGIVKTTKSVLLAGALVAIPIAAALVLELPGVNDLSPVDGFGQLAFPVEWLPLAIVISIVASWAIAHNYDCRSGGFIGAALMGMFIADVWQIAAAVVIATISYVVVAKVLMRHMILFGRRKFSAMLLTSAAIAWPALWVGNQILGEAQLDHVGVGSLALSPLLLPGLLANDVQRTGPSRVVLGVSLSGMSTVSVTWWIIAATTGQALELVWKLVALFTTVILIWPQIAAGSIALARRLEPLADAERRRAVARRVGVALQSTAAAATARVRSVARPVRVSVSPSAPVLVAAASGGATPRPANIDWSTSWAAWASAHPDEIEDARRWLDDALGAAPGDLSTPAPATIGFDGTLRVRTAPPRTVTTPATVGLGDAEADGQPGRSARTAAVTAAARAPERCRGRANDLERAAVHALSRLLERSPASPNMQPAPSADVSLRSPNSPLPGVNPSRPATAPQPGPVRAESGLPQRTRS